MHFIYGGGTNGALIHNILLNPFLFVLVMEEQKKNAIARCVCYTTLRNGCSTYNKVLSALILEQSVALEQTIHYYNMLI